MNSVNKHLFLHSICALGLELLSGPEELEASGKV